MKRCPIVAGIILLFSALSAHTIGSPYSLFYDRLERCLCDRPDLDKVYINQNTCLLYDEIPQDLNSFGYATYSLCQKEYNNVRFNYNKRFNIFPHAIFTPRTYEEVGQVLRLLRKHHLPFALRSGGHCYGPGSLSSGYVIDVKNFNSIVPNLQKKEVFVGAGCLLGDVIQALGKFNFAIPTGTCPSVGVTGLALGGGIAFLFRQFGLTSDSIKEIVLMTADSKILHVSQDNHPDLFWALRGAGGGSYGIVLGFVFKMHYIPHVTTLELTWNWSPAIATEVIRAWQNWITTLPRTISTELALSSVNGKPTIGIEALKIGTQPFNEWKQAFTHLHPRSIVSRETYLQSAERVASVYNLPFSKAKSKFLFQPLSDAGIQVMVNFINSIEQVESHIIVKLILGAGGGAVTKTNSAFFARDALMYFFLFSYWNLESQTPASLALLNNFYNDISPFCSPYSYGNLVDYDLGNTYLNAYYGDHVERLVRIKRKYDPHNIFKWKQSIPVSL